MTTVKVKRGDAEKEFPNIVLLGTVTAYVNPYLGVLPLRDDPQPGVQVRYVYPKSPADAAGIKEGARIMKAGRADAKSGAQAAQEQQPPQKREPVREHVHLNRRWPLRCPGWLPAPDTFACQWSP